MSPSSTPPLSSDVGLSHQQADRFHRDGYLVIPDFFDPAPTLARARELIKAFEPSKHPLTKFTTGEGDENEEHVGNRYFLESGSSIRYFLEAGAVGPDGKLNREAERSVNKCGHALHALDPVFYDLSFAPRVQAVVKSLDAFQDPRTLQSMIICKQPSIGGAVPSHNDSTFLHTTPSSAVGLWFALEDCTASNGCLSFLAGSHLHDSSKALPPYSGSRPRTSRPDLGVPRGVNKRFVRCDPLDVDQGTTFETLSTEEEAEWSEERAKMEECKAGSLVLIHGSVLHQSKVNLSDKSRYIYTFHVIEGDENVARYDERNWLQPTSAMPFSRLYAPPARP